MPRAGWRQKDAEASRKRLKRANGQPPAAAQAADAQAMEAEQAAAVNK